KIRRGRAMALVIDVRLVVEVQPDGEPDGYRCENEAEEGAGRECRGEAYLIRQLAEPPGGPSRSRGRGRSRRRSRRRRCGSASTQSAPAAPSCPGSAGRAPRSPRRRRPRRARSEERRVGKEWRCGWGSARRITERL